MLNTKNSGRQNTPVKDHRSATEYRLSISSTPGSRRSSLGVANNEGSESENTVSNYLLPQLRELTDAVITLDSNFTQMNFIHESLVDLNESVSALLYGLMCNSWCVDFPNMPHDTGAENKFKQALHNLEDEKQHLLTQIALRDEQDRASEVTNTYNREIATLRRNGGVASRVTPQLPQHTVWGPAAASDYNNEEDSTDASFVSNPAVTNPAVSSAAEKSRRMRRKSILHAMRSSVAGTQEISDPERRRSLAVSASRIIGPPRNAPSRSGPSRNSAVMSHSTKTRASKDLSTNTKRPPFR
ncbi:LAME_0F09186g1_1 [Lachancea meyersii CBS 8951]|uniref:DASH complex subunit DAM1 n=1 Tax=Lachancea meyersii CBS 8951 TaxID=1266667 RepID=A0A1G4JV57_9SACH|nr:LAME_0F09186g1_1 [Lachancea meyersii CBS 8951]